MKISEVSKKYNLTPVTLRYYEKNGLIPRVNRISGKRSYTESDLNWIEFIKCMRQVKIPVKELSKYTSLFQQGTNTKEKRRKILSNELDRLIKQDKDIQETIIKLKNKIKAYDEGKID